MSNSVVIRKKAHSFRLLHLVFVIITLMSVSSCAYKPYNLVMRNIGAEDVRNVEIMMGERSFSFGWLTPDNGATHVRPSAPLKNDIYIIWARGDGSEKYNSNLSLPQLLPTLKTKEWYEVIVTINDTNEAALKVLVCIPPYGPCK